MIPTPVVITDLTRMHPPRVCLAGYEFVNGEPTRCIRPVLREGAPADSWLVNATGLIRPFCVVVLRLDRPEADPPHCEDWRVGSGYRVVEAVLDPQEQRDLLLGILDEDIQGIFGAPLIFDGHWFVKRGTGSRSLGTIRVSRVIDVAHCERRDIRKWQYRLVFSDESDHGYNLAVTDLAFRCWLDSRRRAGISAERSNRELRDQLDQSVELFLRVGLARGWSEHPDRCSLQITGVYSFPDYLEGRCFIDLMPPEDRPRHVPFDLTEAPF